MALSICIIAHNACGAMRGGVTGHIGGAEQQTALLARWLASRGYVVSLLTWDEGLPQDTEIDGVRMISICRGDAGIPGLRFIYPRGIGLFNAMSRAGADVYYHNSAEAVTGLAAAWCRRRGKQFIYSVASDVACERSLPTLHGFRDRALYRYGLKHADRIIVQTQWQADLIKESFGRGSLPVPMPCRVAASADHAGVLPSGPPRVAWVGRIDRMKRMEWVLDIAERLPGISFDVVGANLELAAGYPGLAAYARQLAERAQSIPNVIWHGGLRHEVVTEIYRNALCLCCTSSYEGFPNTFLEAWSQARPVVTSFDPDGVIQAQELGSFGGSVADLATAIGKLVESPEEWRRQSMNCLDYFSRTHSLEVAMPRLEGAIFSPSKSPDPGGMPYTSQQHASP